MDDTRKCTICEGDGKHPIHRERLCVYCKGRGVFHSINVDEILKRIIGRGGRKLCSRRPKEVRAYYVWRMARFYGGVDTTIPVIAFLEIHGDPFQDDLDKIADDIAKKYYG